MSRFVWATCTHKQSCCGCSGLSLLAPVYHRQQIRAIQANIPKKTTKKKTWMETAACPAV